jgi:UDP-GlcNAc:undecaprenyl-phosphate GlcNAc-1-phosphate transferase
MLWFVSACLGSAFCVSYVATWIMRHVAPRIGLVDHPAARKVHVTPTPLGGGIGIWLGVVLPIFAAIAVGMWWERLEKPPAWLPADLAPVLSSVNLRAGLQPLLAILAGGTLLSIMGLLDDVASLPWLPRLLVQGLIAVGLSAGGVHATVFLGAPLIGHVVTVVWLLVLINAMNFLDNMDGLSGGIALIAATLFAIVMLAPPGEPRWLVGGVLLVLAGSLAGFLCHNWPPARIFMGDTGSYFVGLLLATMTIQGTFYTPEMRVGRHVMLAPLCVLAVPLYDFCSVVLIRLKEGRSPFHPDKSHFSHRLVQFGLQPRHAVLTIHLATLTTGLGALLLYRLQDWTGALLVVALIACVLAIVAILETVGRRRNGDGATR